MACTKTGQKVPEMSSANAATVYVRRMVENESRGWGDQENALHRLEKRYGLPFWSLENLRKGRAKSIEASMFEKIREAFVDHCRRQAKRLLHDAEMVRRLGEPNDDVATIEDQIRALAARLEAAKSQKEMR